MSATKWSWLPPWPVVPPRLWLTLAASVVVGLSIFFQEEIWPHRPLAKMGSWVVLGLLMQVGGIQLIRGLWAWVGEYCGPRWMQFMLVSAVLPVCFVVALVLLVVFLLLGCGLVSSLSGLNSG